MVGVPASVVSHRAPYVCRHGVQIADQFFNRFLLEVRLPGDRLIHVRDVGAVMFVVMNFHCLRVNIRFERIFGIR